MKMHNDFETSGEFNGIALDSNASQARLLGGYLAKKIHEEIHARFGKYELLRCEWKNAIYPTRYDIYMDSPILDHSTNFYLAAVNMILRERKTGLRTATQADLERALKRSYFRDKLANHNIKTALVLRRGEESFREEEYNFMEYYLTKQLRERNRNTEFPVMIPFASLDLEEGTDSPHEGLAFRLIDNAEVIHSPILSPPINYEDSDESTGSFCFFSEDVDEKTGLPKKLERGGDRSFYTGGLDYGLAELWTMHLGGSTDIEKFTISSYNRAFLYDKLVGTSNERVILVKPGREL